MTHLLKIEHDLFNIAVRLKEIDVRYELYFNRKLKRFEIYAEGAMQIVSPFDRLDGRILSHVRETRIANMRHLLAEIERQNCRREEEATKAAAENMRRVLCK